MCIRDSTPPVLPPPILELPPCPMYPPGAPGAVAFTQHSARIVMTAADSVNDYSPGRITEIAAVFAASAGVSTSAVQVTVTAASVRITTTIIVASAEDAAALNANLTATLATPESATSFLSSVSGGVTVVSAPVVQAVSEEVVGYPPPPAAPVLSG
eukprot:5594306-Prymnesium_polylepis.1